MWGTYSKGPCFAPNTRSDRYANMLKSRHYNKIVHVFLLQWYPFCICTYYFARVIANSVNNVIINCFTDMYVSCSFQSLSENIVVNIAGLYYYFSYICDNEKMNKYKIQYNKLSKNDLTTTFSGQGPIFVFYLLMYFINNFRKPICRQKQ